MTAPVRLVPNPQWAVFCLGLMEGVEGCGHVALTERQYLQMLDRPDDSWRCPKCGADAAWDDDCEETK